MGLLYEMGAGWERLGGGDMWTFFEKKARQRCRCVLL